MMEMTLRWKGSHLSFLLCVLFTLKTLVIPTMCNATKIVHHSQLDQWKVFVKYNEKEENSCIPPWFYFHWETGTCRCLPYYAAKCFDNKAYLFAGHCATFDEDTEILSLGVCPYHGFSLSEHDQEWYTQLPDNISELNDYMCGPLNRKGELCRECKDGYGLAVTSVGFQYFECSKCVGAWYGVPLFLFLELFPLTVLYLVILLSQINIISGSITCFIFCSQLVVIAFDGVFAGDDVRVTDIILACSKYTKWLFTIMMTIYDFWNLRFLRNVLPSFCIVSTLKPIHITFLDYTSVLYPLCLIFLTWICIEMYDRKYRLFVWLWKPFQRCFKGKQCTIDFINAFASFFLLSFTKVVYQAVLLLVQRKVKHQKFDADNHYDYFLGFSLVVGVDQTVVYGSTEHLFFLIPAGILLFVLGLLPTIFLILYPLRPFRVLFSKCRLDGIVINTFAERFYSCYRTGLDGGRDMRSFAGLYFVARFFLFLSDVIASALGIANNDPFFIRNIILAITALLVALCRPYKEMYMNILDTILLIHFGLLSHLVSGEGGFSSQRNLAITYEVMIILPFLCYVLFFIAKTEKSQKVLKNITESLKMLYQKCKSHCGRKNEEWHDCSTANSPSSIRQVLIEPIATYGAIDYTA